MLTIVVTPGYTCVYLLSLSPSDPHDNNLNHCYPCKIYKGYESINLKFITTSKMEDGTSSFIESIFILSNLLKKFK